MKGEGAASRSETRAITESAGKQLPGRQNKEGLEVGTDKCYARSGPCRERLVRLCEAAGRLQPGWLGPCLGWEATLLAGITNLQRVTWPAKSDKWNMMLESALVTKHCCK